METGNASREEILGEIQRTLNRNSRSPVAPRPPILAPRLAGDPDSEIDKLMQEIVALKGNPRRLKQDDLQTAIADLVNTENIHKATLWNTDGLAQLGIADILRALGVEIIPPDAHKLRMAEADLGVTEADFALPETGTIGLLSSPEKPRSVSLLPRVHLAVLHPCVLCDDLHQVFAQAKSEGYLILISGPSRTSDIELVVTIGVHGPQRYYVWIMND